MARAGHVVPNLPNVPVWARRSLGWREPTRWGPQHCTAVRSPRRPRGCPTASTKCYHKPLFPLWWFTLRELAPQLFCRSNTHQPPWRTATTSSTDLTAWQHGSPGTADVPRHAIKHHCWRPAEHSICGTDNWKHSRWTPCCTSYIHVSNCCAKKQSRHSLPHWLSESWAGHS